MEYKNISLEHLQQALNHITEKRKNSSQEMTVFKIGVNEKMLNNMREAGIPEEYLKISIINYEDLVNDNTNK